MPARLGYDGVELMVWAETVSQDVAAVARAVQAYGMPVLAVHAPCLLISQRVWGANPIPKLDRSVRAAKELGAQTVVVHPPFRWQRRYAEGFSEQVARLERSSDVLVAVENMFPFRADRFFGGTEAVDRTDAQARRRPGAGDLGVLAVLRPPGRRPRPLHAGPVAHRDRGHRRARHGTPDGRWPRAPAPVDGTGASTDEHLIPGPRHPADRRGVPDAGRRRFLRPCDP